MVGSESAAVYQWLPHVGSGEQRLDLDKPEMWIREESSRALKIGHCCHHPNHRE